MGIYLGQLPAPEIARLKAELAETLIAHFCYPRFFDNRTDALRMRPVDRAKRQEVWLFLSSVDFTLWNRVDLMSPDFQHQIERLFIQFVQRNRAFFGEQGRKRMSDVRMLINASASSVVQGLRNHLTGQRQGNPPFGSPRSVVSWSQPAVTGSPELNWEQISAATMLLQQQLQELRGEVSPVTVGEAQARSANGATRRAAVRPPATAATAGSAGMGEQNGAVSVQTPPAVPVGNTSATRSGSRRTFNPAPPATPVAPQRKIEQPAVSPLVPAAQVAVPVPAEMPLASTSSTTLNDATGPLPTPVMKSGSSVSSPTRTSGPLPPTSVRTSGPLPSPVRISGPLPDSETVLSSAVTAPSPPVYSRGMAQAVQATATDPRDASQLKVGEDDMAIFEQMRHQLIVWLRVEAIRAGLEVSTNLGPAQLLDMLRQQAHFDETRLQVVSTLLNMSNQIIRTGVVSVLDYKQALMFHLMHTRH